MSTELKKTLEHFKRCADEAPQGTYEDAKRLNEVIGNTCDNLIKEIRALGLKADTCDLIFAVEATIYDYVKRSNPAAPLFPVAEGFGSAMDGPARDRVIAQAERDRDILAALGHSPAGTN